MSRLLLLTNEFPPFCGGIATYAESLARSAHALGHEVSVLAPRYPGMEHGDNGYPFPLIRTRYFSSSTKPLAYRAAIARQVIRRVRPDVVHAIDMAWLVALWALPLRAHYLASVHGTEVMNFSQRRLTGAFFRRVFTRPNRVVTNSEFTRQLFLTRFPQFPAANVRAALLGVDPYWFEDAGDIGPVSRRYGLTDNDILMVTVARLDKRKGHGTVLRALAQLPADLARRMVYLIVGEGDSAYRQELLELATQSQARVIMTGVLPRGEVRQLYRLSRMHCMPGEPSRHSVEGFGLAYLEAAAQGTPSIASHVGGVPEVIRHAETGFLCAPGNVLQVREAMRRLAEDRPLADSMGCAALDFARCFSWSHCARLIYGTAESPAAEDFDLQGVDAVRDARLSIAGGRSFDPHRSGGLLTEGGD